MRLRIIELVRSPKWLNFPTFGHLSRNYSCEMRLYTSRKIAAIPSIMGGISGDVPSFVLDPCPGISSSNDCAFLGAFVGPDGSLK